MKVFKFFAFLLVLTGLAAGCSKQEEAPGPVSIGTVVTAAFEDTRTALQEDGKKVYWESGDAISVNGYASLPISLDDPAAKTNFSFDAVLADTKDAVYPSGIWESSGTIRLPAHQAAGTDQSFGQDAVPMVASAASGNNLTFRPVSALIKVRLKAGATGGAIDYVEFSGNNGEQVCGSFGVDYTTGELTATSTEATDRTVRVSVGRALSDEASSIFISVPPGNYSKGFTVKVVDVNGLSMTKATVAAELSAGAIYSSPVSEFESMATIKDFAEEYVKILDIWRETVGTIDLLKGENYAGGEWNVPGAHYVPSTTTITVGGKTYNTADMLETALRSYLLIRGYDGLDRTHYGAGSIAVLAGGAVGMSATAVPETHGYYWGTTPYNEAPGNGGYFRTTDGVSHVVTIDVLDNWAMRSLNFQSGQAITNMCTYPRSPITGYTGSFCSMRALITYAFFFKYLLDNGYDKGTEVSADAILPCELFQPKATSETDSNTGIWLWSQYMNTVNLDVLAGNDIKNIFLHEVAFTNHGLSSTLSFIESAHSQGLKVHIWLQCFYSDGSWVNPVDDDNNRYKQEYFDEVIERAVKYAGYGVDGIHLDYIRFGGTAYKHNPSSTITAVGAVTEFCRQINVATKAVNPGIILSAALMPEPDSEYYYGQNPAQMGQYMDILIPMIYFRTGGYRSGGQTWAVNVANHFATKGAPAEVWAGLTTYEDTDSASTVPMSAAKIRSDCELFTGTQATGVVLFRYGLGAIPDLNGLWD